LVEIVLSSRARGINLLAEESLRIDESKWRYVSLVNELANRAQPLQTSN
jgi:hypothetical protein